MHSVLLSATEFAKKTKGSTDWCSKSPKAKLCQVSREIDKDSEIFRGEGKLGLDKDSESSGSDVGAGAVWGSFVVKRMLKMVMGQRKCPAQETTMTSVHRL